MLFEVRDTKMHQIIVDSGNVASIYSLDDGNRTVIRLVEGEVFEVWGNVDQFSKKLNLPVICDYEEALIFKFDNEIDWIQCNNKSEQEKLKQLTDLKTDMMYEYDVENRIPENLSSRISRIEKRLEEKLQLKKETVDV